VVEAVVTPAEAPEERAVASPVGTVASPVGGARQSRDVARAGTNDRPRLATSPALAACHSWRLHDDEANRQPQSPTSIDCNETAPTKGRLQVPIVLRR
jgi:hypothetical protein